MIGVSGSEAVMLAVMSPVERSLVTELIVHTVGGVRSSPITVVGVGISTFL